MAVRPPAVFHPEMLTENLWILCVIFKLGPCTLCMQVFVLSAKYNETAILSMGRVMKYPPLAIMFSPVLARSAMFAVACRVNVFREHIEPTTQNGAALIEETFKAFKTSDPGSTV